MKTELHLHTSRYSACSQTTPGEVLEAMILAGYEAAYITEHEAVWDDSELADLQAAYPQIRLFPGVELTTIDYTLHILVLGTNDPAYVDLQRDPRAVFARARQAGHLTVVAHPFRWGAAAEMLESGAVPDALEYRTNNHSPEAAEQSDHWASKLGLPLLNAGDVHLLEMIDRFWIDTRRPIESATDIRPIVLAGEYNNRSAE